MEIKISIPVNEDVLENIFVTALEGGSNYWYFINEKSHRKIRKAVPVEKEEALSVALYKAVMEHDVEVEIYDLEEEWNLLGVLHKDLIAERLQKLADNPDHKNFLLQEIKEEGDAGTSDAVFQYLVMGEIVFG